MPAYNEEANIRSVAEEWHEIIVRTGIQSRLVIIDDGSKDHTCQILQELSKKLPQLISLTKSNGGHGAAILYGYNYALENKADYVFQTDSDGQTVPMEFWPFWEQRNEYSALIGYRNHREDGLFRIFVTKVLKLILWFVFQLNIADANVPFRLIKAEILRKYISKMSSGFHLSNVILAVCLIKYNENVKFIPITFKSRQGGVNSINFLKIIKIGRKAVKDFIIIEKEIGKNKIWIN
jgi:glycosyltransferase involved in cell wall biosynthesis